MDLKAQLIPKLKALRLSGILETLDVRTQQAIADKLSYVEFLERLLEDEVERRAQKQLMLRLRRASFRTEKNLEGFDWTFSATINRKQILDLVTGQWIERKEGVLIVGPSGVGRERKRLQRFTIAGTKVGELRARDPIRAFHATEGGTIVQARQHQVEVRGLVV